MDKIDRSESSRARGVLTFLCLASGFLVMGTWVHVHTIMPAMSIGLVVGIQVAVIAGFLVSSMVLYRNVRLRKYWRLAFAYFVASCAAVLSNFTGDWAVVISGQSFDTAKGFTVLKLTEDATVVGTIIALMLLTRDDPGELFLAKGRLGLGLTIGLSGFLSLTVIGLSSAVSQYDDPGRVRDFLLMFGSISLADGLMEELLFRGLFLKRLARSVGDDWANVVTALVFTFAHQVLFDTPSSLLFVFFFGLLFGWIMQKTGSVLASVLLHAGLDMVIIADFLERYYGVNI